MGPSSQRRGDPNVAVLLTWFLPGAGHFYLGSWVAGVVAFVLIEGLYALGWILSGGRTFEFLDPELRGVFATILTPEVGNLGAMIAQIRQVGFGTDEALPYSATVHLGSTLTALSGILNLVVMVSANLTARTPEGAPKAGLNPAFLVGAAWAVPGLGHFLQGRRLRAIIVFSLLVGFFLLGTLMADGSNLSRERHFYYWSGQFLVGLPAILTEFLSGRPPITGALPFADVGLLYACMPGLLNVLAMLDVYGVAEKRWLGIPDAPAEEGEQEAVA
jgi:TM2 domain-containing membrane protein YozV